MHAPITSRYTSDVTALKNDFVLQALGLYRLFIASKLMSSQRTNFSFHLIFIFPSFSGMSMYANKFETEGKQKINWIKKFTARYISSMRGRREKGWGKGHACRIYILQ